MRFRQETFKEHLAAIVVGSVPDIEIKARRRKLIFYSSIPLMVDWIQEKIFIALLRSIEIPGGLVRGSLPGSHQESLRETLEGSQAHLYFSGKKGFLPGMGERWEYRIDLKKIERIVIRARKVADAIFVRGLIAGRGLEFISNRDIISLTSEVFACSPRRAAAIKGEMEHLGWIRTNGHRHTDGSEVLI
jgi:hypothetical protein